MPQFDKAVTAKHSIWRPYHLFLVVGLLMASTLFYSISLTHTVSNKNAPIIDAAGEIRFEVTLAHLWFEEIISGDRNENMITDVTANLDQANWYLDAMRNGGAKAGFGTIIPIDDPTLMLEVQNAQDDLKKFEEIMARRLYAVTESGVGTPIDQEFDIVFASLLNQISQLEKELKAQNRTRNQAMQNSQYGLIILVLLLSLVAWIVARRYEKSRDAALIRLESAKESAEESQQWLFTTMNSMGDAVITTNVSGEIDLMNPVAEKLTGWSLSEAKGKPLSRVFNIINEISHAPVETPFDKIIRDKMVVGLANHTALITKNGDTIPIADSGAPILDDDNNLLGVVLIFRDVTKERHAQRALKKSEAQFRAIVTNAQAVIFMIDTDGIFTLSEGLGLSVLGLKSGQVVGMSAYEIYKDFPAIVKGIKRALTGEIYRDIIDVGGIFFDIFYSPHLDGDGNIIGTIGMAVDITAQHQAQVALEASETQYRHLIEYSPVGIIILQNQKIVFVNPKLLEDLGYDSTDEVLGFPILKFIHPNFHEVAKQRLGKLMSAQGERVLGVEEKFIRKNGEMIDVLVLGQSIDYHGKPAIQGYIYNITERKKAEQEIRHLQNYLINVVNSMPSILVGVDTNLRITQWNTEAERINGITRQDAIGRPLLEVIPYIGHKTSMIHDAIKSGETQRQQNTSYNINGETRYQDIIIFPLIANHIEGAVVRVDDVTERVRTQELLIQSEKMLSVGGLAAGMAHEINNPLAGMMQNSQVIRNRISPDLPKNHRVAKAHRLDMGALQAYMTERGIFDMLDAIDESGKRAAKIIRSMLNFSRKSESHFAFRNLADLLDETVELANNDYDLKKQYDFRQIQITREYAEDTPKVQCDAGKIQQVFLNIIRNGAQAMAEQKDNLSPHFILRVYPQNDMVCVEIEDNGPGISRKVRNRIFEPFFTTKDVGVGTGLGLSVSYFIITENHHGKMSVKSKEGEGATFIIQLPLSKDEASQ